jgi:hypothetical protein
MTEKSALLASYILILSSTNVHCLKCSTMFVEWDGGSGYQSVRWAGWLLKQWPILITNL